MDIPTSVHEMSINYKTAKPLLKIWNQISKVNNVEEISNFFLR